MLTAENEQRKLFSRRRFDGEFSRAGRARINHNRWYDPVVGRWLSQDPIGFAGGDANLYRYCQNSPLVRTDPTGLMDWSLWPTWLDRNTSIEAIERAIKEGLLNGKGLSLSQISELRTAKKLLQQARRIAQRGPGIRPPGPARVATPFTPLQFLFEFLDMWGRSRENGTTIEQEYERESDDMMDEMGCPRPRRQWDLLDHGPQA